MRLAEPVSKNRPAAWPERRSRSTAALIGRKSPGARWISSSATTPYSPSMNPAGSLCAAASVVGSSSVR